MKILADASLPGLEAAFLKPFQLSFYSNPKDLEALLQGQDVLLCRSTLKVNAALLKNTRLQYVATASSGIDHLDSDFLNSAQITILDAKGSNALSVADYVLGCVDFLNSAQITILDAKGSNALSVADYVLASVAYLQQETILSGKKAGIIGMGAVGAKVKQCLEKIGFEVYCYDPLKALSEDFLSCALEELYEMDLLCIHPNLHSTLPFPSAGLINADFLSLLNPNCVLINASRGGVVDEQALLGAKVKYCTDVYSNEPLINKKIVDAAILCTPHIAGHSLEAKWMAVEMISKQLHQILKLPLPIYEVPVFEGFVFKDHYSGWEELVLDLYNPLDETLKLKQALDKKAAFLQLRKEHLKRHDFARMGLDLNFI